MEQKCILGHSTLYRDSNEIWILLFGSLDTKDKYRTEYAASVLTYRIKELKHVINDSYGYKDIITGGDKDNICTRI